MRIPINKIGNLEVEHNTLKYRIPLSEVGSEDINVLEKNLKRKVQSIEHEPYYLAPFELQIINNAVIYYYNMVQYKSFDFLRQVSFKEKLKYYLSLIELAKRAEITNILWDRHNFVVDPHEEKIKAIIYESEDIKIHEVTESLESVRNLILISLTTLNTIIGKPRRVDFIDQDEDIIQFAETLLSGKIETIEDLGFFIETKQIEYDHEKTDEIISSQEVKKKKILSKKGKTKKISNPIQKSKPKKQSGNPKNKKSNFLIIVLALVLVGAVLLNIALPKNAEKSKENNNLAKKDPAIEVTASSNKNKNQKGRETASKFNSALLEAYRSSLIGKNDDAIKILEGIGYENLGDKDQQVLLNLYQKNGEVYKIIDLVPSQAIDIVNNLIANGKESELPSIQEKMKTKNPYVDFEVAYLNQDWAQVIKLKDQVEINGRKERQITEAYLNLKQIDMAKKYADSVGDPDLLQMTKGYSSSN